MALRPDRVKPVAIETVAARTGAVVTPSGSSTSLTGATVDSRQVRPGDLFGALPGFTTHGSDFAPAAAAGGASAVLTDRDGEARARATGLPVLVSEDARNAMGEASACVYGEPSRALTLVGVTGTNGKTTTTYFVDAALHRIHPATGLLGTVEMRVAGESIPAVRTTVEAPVYQALLARMVEAGATAATTEVSSHALSLGRVAGTRFSVAVFTNLQWDHLDFHASMEDYFEAKASLFDPGLSDRGVVCVDDEWGIRLAKGASIPVERVASRPDAGDADWTVRDVGLGNDGVGSVFALVAPDGAVHRASTPLAAHINVSNAAVAIVAAHAAGVPLAEAIAGVAAAPGVPGRMERVLSRDAETPLAIVDYAHTPDALQRVLEGARAATPGRLISVFGSGGDRDTGKRPKKGRIAAALADVVIITDDNPRSEDPASIRSAILDGVRDERPGLEDVHEIAPREEAIDFALSIAEPRDTILLSGKGHEEYQEIAGEKHHFSDPEQVRDSFARQRGRR